MGRWFYWYLILDLYSRKIVGWGRLRSIMPAIPNLLEAAEGLLLRNGQALPRLTRG